MPKQRLKQEHAEATRDAIVECALSCFSQHGYARASLDEIGEKARVTKGAIYHHFRSKRDLYLAVYELLAAQLLQRLEAAQDSAADAGAQLRAAIDVLLLSADDAATCRILFEEGTAVLGPESQRVDADHFLGFIETMLLAARAKGQLRPVDVRVLSRILLAGLTEASTLLAEDPAEPARREQVRAVLDCVVSGVLLPSVSI